MTATTTPLQNGRYDRAKRRLGLRRQRQRGINIYIPAEELAKAGFDPNGPAPAYRVWGAPRGRVVVQLYREA